MYSRIQWLVIEVLLLLILSINRGGIGWEILWSATFRKKKKEEDLMSSSGQVND
jgi:hypothetical protein